MTEKKPSTDLTTTFTSGRIALRDGASLLDVAETLIEPLSDETTSDVIPFPEVPKTPILTDSDRAALALLPSVYGKTLVTERRTLTGDEISDLHVERETVKKVLKVLEGRVDVINENIRTHVDVEAVNAGLDPDAEGVLRDKDGHIILARPKQPTRVHIPGTNQDFSLEFRAGSHGGVVIESNHLLDLYEAGEITRDQYLALTSERRVFDEDKARKSIIKDPTLLDVIRRVTKRTSPTKPGASLFVRPTKTK